MTGPLTDNQVGIALNDPSGAALKTGAASVWTELAVLSNAFWRMAAPWTREGARETAKHGKWQHLEVRPELFFSLLLHMLELLFLLLDDPQRPLHHGWQLGGFGHCQVTAVCTTQHSCFTSVYLTQVTSVCTVQQLFYFSLPDTGYFCLHNIIVSLQSTWHRLLPSAQRNCFTSVYR